MRFSSRNTYYLRISSQDVLPLIVYLDDRHVEWMSERVLQYVLADLKNLIPVKLMIEQDAYIGPSGPSSSKKKGTLDVHRGDTYQFGYFLKKTDPHTVVIKTRQFVPRPHQPPPTRDKQSPTEEPAPSDKRKRRAPRQTKQPIKKRRTKGKQRAKDSDEDEPIVISTDEEEDDLIPPPQYLGRPRRSARARKIIGGGYREDDDDEVQDDNAMDIDDQTSIPANEQEQGRGAITSSTSGTAFQPIEEEELSAGNPTVGAGSAELPAVKTEDSEPTLASHDIDIDDDSQASKQAGASKQSPITLDVEAENSKPLLKMRYEGFQLHGRCLCVIVEPYPPITTAKPLSLHSEGLKAPPAPSTSVSEDFMLTAPRARDRMKTPLFLPDDDDDFGRGETPAPSRPPVPLFGENMHTFEDDDEGRGGMFELSQILQSTSGHTAVVAEDDDEMEGAVFFGDADEAKEF